jgi:hypothetical protein
MIFLLTRISSPALSDYSEGLARTVAQLGALAHCSP